MEFYKKLRLLITASICSSLGLPLLTLALTRAETVANGFVIGLIMSLLIFLLVVSIALCIKESE